MTPPPDDAEGQFAPVINPNGEHAPLIDPASEYAPFVVDAGGTIASWNPGVRRVLGWEEAEFVGQPFELLFTPEDVAERAPEREMAVAAQEGLSPDTRWHVKKGGERFFATGVLHPLLDDGGRVQGYAKVVADATARRRAELRLARKAALIDLSGDAIFALEAATNRVTFWSRGAQQTYGYTREEALGRVAAELLRTEFPVSYDDIMAALAATGRWEGDLAHTRKDGARIVVASRWALARDAGDGAEVLEVNRDVTEQRRLEAAREEYLAQQERIAEALQRSLLISPPPDLYPGLTVKAYYAGAEEDVLVGGDFFDIFAVSENRVALVVGDATGKGLEAATYTAELKFALRAFLREYPAPAVALTRLNRFVAENERLDPRLGRSYATAALAVVDTATGAVEAALAGMEMPLLLRMDTGESVLFPAGGPPLGVVEGWEFTGQRDALRLRDVLVMSTDGITEARHPARRLELFGTERLARAVREEAAKTPSLAEVGLSVVRRARAFAGGAIHDDVCLLLARRAPAGPGD